MARYSIAIVGVGKITRDQHLPSIAANRSFDLKAVVSSSGAKVEGVPTFKTQSELFSAFPRLTAVALNMPPQSRHPYAREALLAGKHVLMEKPPTASVAELDDLVALAARKKRVLFATWHSQFNKPVYELKRILKRDGVKSLRIDWREDVRKWHPGQEWVWSPGGFGVFDPGINALSIFTDIMPAPVFVTDARLEFPSNRETPIAAEIGFRMTGSEAKITAGFDWRETSGEIWTMTIESGKDAKIRLENGGGTLIVDGEVKIRTDDTEYPDIYRRFAKLLAAGRSDVDARPLWLVADAFLKADRRQIEPFEW